MTQRAQRAWAAALRRAALPSCVLAVNPVDINRLCAAYMPWPAAAHIGRAYDLQELQINLITLSGNVDEDEDSFTLRWNS